MSSNSNKTSLNTVFYVAAFFVAVLSTYADWHLIQIGIDNLDPSQRAYTLPLLVPSLIGADNQLALVLCTSFWFVLIVLIYETVKWCINKWINRPPPPDNRF